MRVAINESWDDLVSQKDLADKFNIAIKTIHNMKSVGDLIEGVHFFKLKGKITMYSKKAIMSKMGVNYINSD